MPPNVPRKRLRASPPPGGPKANASATREPSTTGAQRRKATLYDDLDASATPQSSKHSSTLLHGLAEDDSDSSLTSLSDEEFEDVPRPKRQKVDEDEDEDEDIEFEDVKALTATATDVPVTSGDLELTLNKDTRISLTNPFGEKKGPSKQERKVRNATHCVHVLTLLWHNAIRNSWLCHPEVQATMLSHLPPRLWDEVDRWRKNSGLVKDAPPKPATVAQRKGKGKAKKGAERESRDWTSAAEKLEEGAVDMSHGDPLFRLMQSLLSWWKQRFRVTAPGLRKWGYMSLERLDRLTKAYSGESHDPDRFGERISSFDDFCRCARKCQGSRDIGAQLFTALLRGLGLEARMVANLQSLGFGWNKLEDAELEKDADQPEKQQKTPDKTESKTKKGKTPERKPTMKDKKTNSNQKPRPKMSSGKANVVVIDDSDSLDLEYKDTDDESVVELESTPKRGPTIVKRFDQDLEYPHYWTEVLSPVTHRYIPADPIVRGVVATNRELVESLEPRGAKADKARQIMAYIVAYSHDGTAKDVTVRYLKRQLLPGRTKGVRMPLEKIPVYNRHGKVKRYEYFDWFKVAMSGYRRGDKKHPLTEIDEVEDSTDLKPAQHEKKEVKDGEETLQYYKQSKEFVLARHLKREEVIRPGAVPVKVFKTKAKGGKVEEEDVFLRSDALNAKSAETWHKQGRAPRPGEQPLKRVPYRAATTNRRREILEAEMATGEKVLQGLFSFDQTDWIIPPPIKDGIIPKNEYGNIDLFVEHMCPRGAVHVPFRGTMRVCKRLQIDYAEAVVDFEFGHRMAVPVIQGVVIAEEYHDQVMQELEKDEAERVRKEDEKRRKAALGRWRKFLMGLRIVERIRQDYGEIDDSVSVFSHSKGATQSITLPAANEENDEEMGGGFLPEGYEEEPEGDEPVHHTSSFFPVADEDDAGDENDLIMEYHRQEEKMQAGDEPRPRAKTERGKAGSSKPKAKPVAKARSSRRRRIRVSKDEDEDDDDEDVEFDEWANPDDFGDD